LCNDCEEVRKSIAKQRGYEYRPLPKEEGMKLDSDKPRPELMIPEFLIAVSRVMAFGAKKYEVDNWQLVPNAKSRYIGAALRHLYAFMSGNKNDPETGDNNKNEQK